jgi:hypothetical protein
MLPLPVLKDELRGPFLFFIVIAKYGPRRGYFSVNCFDVSHGSDRWAFPVEDTPCTDGLSEPKEKKPEGEFPKR